MSTVSNKSERIIKFRAWDKEHNEWLRKAFVLNSHGSVFFAYVGGGHIQNNIEITQYTGLKDKNGKEVFEGDWVTCANGSMGVVEYITKQMAFMFATAKYDNEGGWRHPVEGFDESTLEVIGNIYETPELLN